MSAVNALFIGTSNQLGEFELGAAAALIGVVPSVVFGGCATIAVALIWMWLFPELRRAMRDAAGGGLGHASLRSTQPAHIWS